MMMTLTLDEVREIRFPMARRPNEGYRANEVDEFVDRVLDTFTQMNADSERTQAQLAALKEDNGSRGAGDSEQLRAEIARLQQENAALREQGQRPEQGERPAPSVDTAELDNLRQANAELERRNAELARQLEEAQNRPAPVAPLAAVPSPSDEAPKLERLVVNTSAEASPAVIRLVQLATEQAESVVTEAEAEAESKRQAAEAAAEQTTKDAEQRAAQIEADAKAEAERLRSEAKAEYEKVTTDAKNRRQEVFTTLENEREQFAAKIDALKKWESSYRGNLTQHLRNQADALENETMVPSDAPALLGDERTSSATPRLDALLADKA